MNEAGVLPQFYHGSSAALWTGSEMIVLGLVFDAVSQSDVSAGAAYDPATDTWRKIATGGSVGSGWYNASSIVWTGTDMIVWGDFDFGPYIPLSKGARYNPASDSWTAMPMASSPEERVFHSAVWTGNEMVVWGGIKDYQTPNPVKIKTGGVYRP